MNGCNDENLLDLSSDSDYLIEDQEKYRARTEFSEKLLTELERKGYAFLKIANSNENQNNVIGIEWLRNGDAIIKITHDKANAESYKIILGIIENSFKKTNINNVKVQFYSKLNHVKKLDVNNIKTTNYEWEIVTHERKIKIR
jgi:hypothetical protein